MAVLEDIVALEKELDTVKIEGEAATAAEEAEECLDALASIINDYFALKEDLVKAETQVYEFGKIIQSMARSRAEKYKAHLWSLWDTLQQTIAKFGEITFTEARMLEISSLISSDAGSVQAQLLMDDIRDSLAAVRLALQGDLQGLQNELHDKVEADPSGDGKADGEECEETLMIVAENNELTLIDHVMKHLLSEE